MRKGFTLIELLIIVVIIAILGAMATSFLTTNTSTGPTATRTVEVLCPLTTVEAARDTISEVTRYDYFSSQLMIVRSVNGEMNRKSYPTTCVVRDIEKQF